MILSLGSCASPVPNKVNYNIKADKTGEVKEQSIQATWDL